MWSSRAHGQAASSCQAILAELMSLRSRETLACVKLRVQTVPLVPNQQTSKPCPIELYATRGRLKCRVPGVHVRNWARFWT